MGRSLIFSLVLLTFFCQIIPYIHAKCLNDQRSKLLQFREGLQFNVEFGNKLVNWNETMDCCSWGGVGCDSLGRVISLELANQSADIRNEKWKSFFNLQYLEYLNLAKNSFYSATFPVELCNLTRLKYLNLSESGFSGQIPVELSKMSRLVTLDLSGGFRLPSLQIKNPGGLEILLRNLTELKEVNLNGIDIPAPWCGSFSSLSKLQVLSLRGCSLSGSICSSLSNLTSLTVLQLDGNQFSTLVPTSLASLPNLVTLSLVNCDMRGRFPAKIFQMPNLEILDLTRNFLLEGRLPQFLTSGSLKEIKLGSTNFSGPLPESIGNLRALLILDLSQSNFSGEVPYSIGNLRALSELDLSSSNFSGVIPRTLRNLSELVILRLSGNRFNGSVPSFQMCKKLVEIDLSDNAFEGPIPSAHFEGLVDLQFVNFNDNLLSGSFPSSLFAVPSLQTLMVSNNQFKGQIDDQESIVTNASSSLLSHIDLSKNHLGGTFPNFFFYLTKLETLDLSFNSFTGNLNLDMFSKLGNLGVLDLSFNNLSVDVSCESNTRTCLSSFPQVGILKLASCNLKIFPDHLKNKTELAYLDLSSNQISGDIPSWVWEVGSPFLELNLSYNLLEDFQKPYKLNDGPLVLDLRGNLLKGEIPLPPSNIVYLDYSKNNFTKPMPSDFGDYISGCEYFSLSNNNIPGDIPSSICKAKNLKVLDLFSNSLSGRIPACLFANMDDLSVLNLGGNKIEGLIPNSIHGNCALRTLDLSRNVLEGRIPKSLSNCKFLHVLNVGSNYLEDNFPCRLMAETPSLRVLVLRSNRFYGEIRCYWTNNDHIWPNLQIMDIASNNFSGFLPPQLLVNWKGMMVDHIGTKASKPLQYELMDYMNLLWNYQDSVNVIIKGLEVELVKIPNIYTTLDFSSNNFWGNIPEEIGGLTGLYLLNLSHNSLTGTIPRSIGKLAQLGSLDLSMNQLIGEIPTNLENLNFLGFLNLSYNQLVGKIPQGNHFLTFPESSFIGNKELCGFPLKISCGNGSSPSSSSPLSPDSPITSKNNDIDWEYISAALGFSVGLGIIFLMNCFSPRWWQRFYELIFHRLCLLSHPCRH